MHSIYTYIPETNNAPREYIVAAILLLLYMVPISLVPALALLCFYVSTLRSMCTVPNMAVFCSSLTSWFPGMLLTYFLHDFEIVPVAPIIIIINSNNDTQVNIVSYVNLPRGLQTFLLLI
jgi:hypothetical protein